jgi:heterotetrameric sarcosine oxidase delta subunit
MIIACPYCGRRSHVEFYYGGDASLRRPPVDAPAAEWLEFVYCRDNPKGPHLEWWHHTAGCRQWIRVKRDTLTHEILECAGPGDTL